MGRSDRPFWIEERELEAMEETARRVERYLRRELAGRRGKKAVKGKNGRPRAWIVEKMRRKYAGYESTAKKDNIRK